MGVSNGRYHSFLVRIWARKGHFVHGEVTDAATHESVRFREFARLLRFILASVRRVDKGGTEEEFVVVAEDGELDQVPVHGSHADAHSDWPHRHLTGG
jgi:hypothetical protein